MNKVTIAQSSWRHLGMFVCLRQGALLVSLMPCLALAAGIHVSDSGNVIIDTIGTPSIVTSEASDYGIWGQTTGGGAGDVHITNSSVITTSGVNAHGIYGETTYDSRKEESKPTGSIYIENTGEIFTSGISASGIMANGANSTGSIEIENQGDIRTQGALAYGIKAFAGEGKTTIRNTGDITVEGNAGGWTNVQAGIMVSSSSSGDIDIIHDGDILVIGRGVGGGSPMGAFGLFTHAYHNANSTMTVSGNITATGNAPVDAPVSPYQTGIENRAEGGNAVVNYSGGTITAAATADARGIIAWSSSSSTSTKAEVNVGLDGRATEVNAYGSGSYGIIASSGENIVRIGSNASVLGESGVELQGVKNRFVNEGSIKASGSGKNGVGIYAYRGNADVDFTNTGAIEAYYGVVFGNDSGVALNSGSLYNNGTIRSTVGESGFGIYLQANNIDVTLDTGSDITGSIYSNGLGNTVTLRGTVSENSAFKSANTDKRFAMIVESDGSAAANWTLNGNQAQLDGVGSVTIRNATPAGSATPAATSSKLTLNVSGTGNYVFDHALGGDGTFRIELSNTSDRISFSENTGANFSGIVELGTGAFLMGGASGSEGYWNSVALSNAQAGLLIDRGSHFTVIGEQGIGSGGLTLNDGAVFDLVFDAVSGTASAFSMDGGLLSIASGASLLLSGADDFTATADMVFNIITGASAMDVKQGAFSEGVAYDIGGIDFYIHHVGGDIFLSATPVPEPAVYALLVSGLAFAVVAIRRRRSRFV